MVALRLPTLVSAAEQADYNRESGLVAGFPNQLAHMFERESSMSDMLAITSPARTFAASVTYRGIRHELITVRRDNPAHAMITLGQMAELRHGTDYVITRYAELVGDIFEDISIADKMRDLGW